MNLTVIKHALKRGAELGLPVSEVMQDMAELSSILEVLQRRHGIVLQVCPGDDAPPIVQSRNCLHCHKVFALSRRDKRYCSRLCKKYASRKRLRGYEQTPRSEEE